MEDLGTLGGTFSSAVAVNSLGQVAGTASTAGDGEYHATLWSPTASVHGKARKQAPKAKPLCPTSELAGAVRTPARDHGGCVVAPKKGK
jgi:probable HAF family extracellular repeat protein